jgi:hypothetical protein
MLSGVAALALALGIATAAAAQQTPNKAVNDPSVGGQANKCWGETASGIAQLSGLDGSKGGGMGQHSRSATAAEKNGGFSSGAGPVQLPQPRQGVGNVSADLDGPHGVHPGDGGNGVHAANNGQVFAQGLDPVTGLPVGDGEARLIPCEGAEPNLP